MEIKGCDEGRTSLNTFNFVLGYLFVCLFIYLLFIYFTIFKQG